VPPRLPNEDEKNKRNFFLSSPPLEHKKFLRCSQIITFILLEKQTNKQNNSVIACNNTKKKTKRKRKT
jgi:hypothetical protein